MDVELRTGGREEGHNSQCEGIRKYDGHATDPRHGTKMNFAIGIRLIEQLETQGQAAAHRSQEQANQKGGNS